MFTVVPLRIQKASELSSRRRMMDLLLIAVSWAVFFTFGYAFFALWLFRDYEVEIAFNQVRFSDPSRVMHSDSLRHHTDVFAQHL